MPSSRHGSREGSREGSRAGSKERTSSRSSSSDRGVKVYMAMYQPYDDRDPRHWAIYINDADGDDSIHQLIDKFDAGGYKVDKVRYNKSPDRSSKFYKMIKVGSMPSASVERARTIIQGQYVDNRSKTWNCQAWALEALESLEDETSLNYKASGSGLSDLMHYRQKWQ